VSELRDEENVRIVALQGGKHRCVLLKHPRLPSRHFGQHFQRIFRPQHAHKIHGLRLPRNCVQTKMEAEVLFLQRRPRLGFQSGEEIMIEHLERVEVGDRHSARRFEGQAGLQGLAELVQLLGALHDDPILGLMEAAPMGTELFVRVARKDGRSVAVMRAVDYGAECIVETEVLGPPDVEQRIGLAGGNIFQGETLPDQMWDRRLESRTPLEGLYLCGAATHPAGSVIALNGRNAAMAVLEDAGVTTPSLTG